MKTYRGWDIECVGPKSYKLTRQKRVNGQTVTAWARSAYNAKVIIDGQEARIAREQEKTYSCGKPVLVGDEDCPADTGEADGCWECPFAVEQRDADSE